MFINREYQPTKLTHTQNPHHTWQGDMQIKHTITITVQAGIEKESFEIPLTEYFELIRKLKLMDRKLPTPNLIRNPFRA